MSEVPRQNEKEPVKEKEAVVFRDLKLEDCDDMVKVMNSLVEEKAPIIRQTPKTKEEQMEDLKKIVESLEKNEGVYKVAEEDGHVVGWAGLSAIKEEEDKKVGTLGVILLEKAARGTGIADNLLETTIQEAQETFGLNKVFLYTFAFNERAIKLYKRHGFEKTDEKVPSRDYYGKKRKRIGMVKILE